MRILAVLVFEFAMTAINALRVSPRVLPLHCCDSTVFSRVSRVGSLWVEFVSGVQFMKKSSVALTDADWVHEQFDSSVRRMTVGRYEEIRRRLVEGRGLREIRKAYVFVAGVGFSHLLFAWAAED